MPFGFASIKHAFAWVAQEIVKGAPYLEETEAPVEAVTAILDPPLVTIERAAYQALGKIMGTIHDTAVTGQSVIDAKGLSVALDQQEVQDFLSIWQQLQPGLVKVGVLKQKLTGTAAASAAPKV